MQIRTRLGLVALGMLGLVIGTPADAAPVARPKPSPAAPAATARPKAGSTVDLSKLPRNDQLRRTSPSPSPALSALTLAALRRFAEGGANPNALDRAITRSLSRIRNGRKIAKRIVARIDALPEATRLAAFGDAPTNTSPSSVELVAAVQDAGLVFGGIGATSPDTLPAEGYNAPASYKVRVSGIAGIEAAEPDGDEVVAMVSFVTCYEGKSFGVKTTGVPTAGTVDGVTAGSTVALDKEVYDGKIGWNHRAMIVSAAFEADDDDAATREEYTMMVGLAKGLAEQLLKPGDTADAGLGRFVFALDYSVGMLMISAPAKWPPGALQKTMMDGSAKLDALYATAATMDGAVPWKLAHDHDLPIGRYKLYFDVPAPPLVQPNLKIKLTQVQSLDPESGGDDMTVTVGIKGAEIEHAFKADKNLHSTSWTVQRELNLTGAAGNKANVNVTLSEHDDGPVWGWVSYGWSSAPCGDHPGPESYAPCPDGWTALDINPTPASGEGWFHVPARTISFTVDMVTGAITGEVTGQVGDTLTLQGTNAPRGKISLVVTKED